MEYQGHSLVRGAVLQQMAISLPRVRVFAPLRLCVAFLLRRCGLENAGPANLHF